MKKLIPVSTSFHLKKSATASLFFLFCVTMTSLQAQEIQVPIHEGTNMASQVSPDGQTIAIDIQGTIGIVSIAGGTVKLLTDGMGDERQPAWSPDGNRIIFQSYRDGNFHAWSIRKDGTDLKQMTFGMYDHRELKFSPDGKKIIFSTDRSGNYDVWEMTLATGDYHQITKDPGNDFHPAYSTDGKKIAFISTRDKGGVFVIDESGQEQLVVPTKGLLNAPAWSPNGSSLSFTSFYKAKSQLMVVNVASGEIRTMSGENEDVFPFRASWLSENELIYTSDGKIQRKTLDKQPSRSIVFTATYTVSPPSYPRKQRDFDSDVSQKVLGIVGPVVSPDGNATAFNALGDIWVLKHSEGKTMNLTQHDAADTDPAWSYDGRYIAFASDRGGNYMNIWMRDMQTGADKQITTFERNALQPAFSPDGKKLAFLLADGILGFGPVTLHVIDLVSGEVKPLHKPMFTPGKPTWSGDGKLVALAALEPNSSRFREGQTRILYAPANGDPAYFYSPVEARSIGARGKNGPVWSPDGSKIAYIQDAVLWIVQVDATGKQIHSPRRLTNELAEAPSWTGDSRSIVFMATDRLKKIFLNDGHMEDIPCTMVWKTQKNQGQIVIHAGQVFDGRSATYLKNVDITLEGNRIKEIVPHKNHGSVTVIDASDKTVIPGIFEMHTHHYSSAGELAGRNWLAYGITSVRETGGDPYDALERKESWGSGARKGPRLFFTGNLLEGGRVYYDLATSVSTGLQIDMELERARRLGYDFLKTYVRFPDYYQRSATAMAHAIGIPVSSHEIYPSNKYGVDAVEHMSATSRRGYSPKLTAMNRNYEDVVQILAKSGMNMTPTIALEGGFFSAWQQDPAVSKNRQLNALYSKTYIDQLDTFSKQMVISSEEAGDRFSELQRTLKKMHTAGVRLTAGTDSPFITYGLSLHVEMQNFVSAGLTPYQTLQAATLFSAQAIGVDKDLGTIEAGKLADLVIVKGDPLKNIQDAWNVEIVFKNGIRYNIENLLKGK